MFKKYLLNAFSLNMLKIIKPTTISIFPIPIDKVKELLADGFISAVGHEDTAKILTKLLDLPVEYNRINVTLDRHSMAIVAQYIGPRLPEGVTELPEGVKIDFYLVVMQEG